MFGTLHTAKSTMRALAITMFAGFLSLSSSAQYSLITTIAGNGISGYSGDGGAAVTCKLSVPVRVATDNAGNVYILDYGNFVVRKINTSGIISTIAGNGSDTAYGDGGPATAAGLGSAIGMAVDGAGNIFLADDVNSIVRKVNTAGIISRYAGVDTAGFAGDGGPATDAALRQPKDVAVDGAGNVYISDAGNAVIRKVAPDGTISTYAGVPGVGGYSGNGGPATDANLSDIFGICTDGGGNLYLAESYPMRVIRKVGTDGVISLIAGDTSATATYGNDMPATATALSGPGEIAVDDSGYVYFSEEISATVRRVDLTGVIRAFAGNGHSAFGGDGGFATMASLNSPIGLCVAPDGSILFCDTYNNRVRKVYNGSLSVADNVVDGFSMYPNPANKAVNIRLQGATGQVEISMYDATGRKVLDVQHTGSEMGNGVSLDIPGELLPGTYMVQVLANTGVVKSILVVHP